MKVSSKSFENGGIIPKKHTGFGEDVSPELALTDVPKGTVSLAIIPDNPDVPFRKSFTHWIVWNIPKPELTQEEWKSSLQGSNKE